MTSILGELEDGYQVVSSCIVPAVDLVTNIIEGVCPGEPA